MALKEMDDNGRTWEVPALEHRAEFDRTWHVMTQEERDTIDAEINRRLDHLINEPDPNWGSITNTSIEGGRTNAGAGMRGYWTGTVFEPIFHSCGGHEEVAGMFYASEAEEWVDAILGVPL